jgi:hypothetical protein
MTDDVALIREAARLMRQRAEAAKRIAPAPWRQILTDSESLDGIGICEAHTGDPFAACDNCWTIETWSTAFAEHAASCHPGVMLLVADLLMVISWMPSFADPTDMTAALALARGYLGKESP